MHSLSWKWWWSWCWRWRDAWSSSWQRGEDGWRGKYKERPTHSGNLEHYVMLAPPSPRAPAPSPLRSIRAALAPSSALKSYWLRRSQLLGTGQERERDAVKQKLLQDSFFYHNSLQRHPEKADIPSESRCLAPVVLLRLETHLARGRSRSRNKVRRPSSNLPARARSCWVPKARMSAKIPETHPDTF